MSRVTGATFFGGDLYDIKEGVNLTDQRRSDARRKLLGTLSESEMIVFSPKDPKYTITVFTDVDCGFCRKLHSEIGDLNRMGVRVRYAFYPREGPGSESWKMAEAVWCSANRQDALTRAKRGETIKAKDCGATPGRARVPDGARSQCSRHAGDLHARRVTTSRVTCRRRSWSRT